MKGDEFDKRCVKRLWILTVIAGAVLTVIINYEDICSMLGTIEYPISLIWFVKIFGGFGTAFTTAILIILIWRRWQW